MAADLYSVGTLTTALFGSQSYFTLATSKANPSEEEIMREAMKCDFNWLDCGLEWHAMSCEAKDLVKRLLVLDDVARLRARSSLGHMWFTAGSGKEVIARYEKSIQGWHSRAVPEDLDEDIFYYLRSKRLEQDVCVWVAERELIH